MEPNPGSSGANRIVLTTVSTTSPITSQMPMFLSRLFKQSPLADPKRTGGPRTENPPGHIRGRANIGFYRQPGYNSDWTSKSKHDSRQTPGKACINSQNAEKRARSISHLLPPEPLSDQKDFPAAVPRRLRLADIHVGEMSADRLLQLRQPGTLKHLHQQVTAVPQMTDGEFERKFAQAARCAPGRRCRYPRDWGPCPR